MQRIIRTKLVVALTAVLALAAVVAVNGTAWAAVTGTVNPAVVTGATFTWTCDINPGGATVDVVGASWVNADGSAFVETAKQRISGGTSQRLTFSRAGVGQTTYGYRCKWYSTTGGLLGKTTTYLTATTDTIPPDTSITATMAAETHSTDASLSFTATEPATFECNLDGATYTGCVSPKTYSGLALGSHTFSVRATDAAGNVDVTPATRTWTITTDPFKVTVSALDASPAPGSNWDTDYVDKADRFSNNNDVEEQTDLLNMPRLFFSPSQTMTWSAPMMAALHDGEVPIVSKKANYTAAEVQAFVDNMPARFPRMYLIYNHEVQASNMSAATYIARNQEWRNIINASPNAGRVRLVANFMQYQIDHNSFDWRSYLGSNPGAIWDVVSSDIYNEPWQAGAVGGYETLENVLGSWPVMVDEIEGTLCTTCHTAIVEYGANLEAGGLSGQLKLYDDAWKWSNGYRRTCPTCAWPASPTGRNMLWVGWWADNAISPVWHDANNTTNPVQVLVRDTMQASRGVPSQR